MLIKIFNSKTYLHLYYNLFKFKLKWKQVYLPLVRPEVTSEPLVETTPHAELGSELSNALACVTAPRFNQQVPPLNLLNAQCVQPFVFAHNDPHWSPWALTLCKSFPLKSHLNAQLFPFQLTA